MKTYSQYSKTNIPWNEEMPSHWNTYRGKRVFLTHKEKNTNNTESNVLSLTLKGVVKNNGDRPIGLSPSDYSTYQIFEKDDLVFKLIDLNNISTSRVGLVPERGIMSSAYIRLIAREELNIRYFYLQYYNLWLRNIYNGLGAGVRQTISASELLNINIVVPPRSEQDQIVRFLDWKVSGINRLINIKKKEIKELKEQELLQISNHVLHGFNHTTFKDSGNKWIGQIPDTWETIKLGKFARFQNGISESGDFFTAGYPFVGYGDVYRHYELPRKVEGLAKSNEQQQETYSVKKGDIFFTRTSENIEEIGMAAVCKETIDKAVFSGFVIRCRPYKELVDLDYIKYYLQIPAIRNHFSSMMNIVIRASLSQTLLKEMPVVIPPLSEQHEIAKKLDELHGLYLKMVNILEQEITELKELKSCLISDVVTGKIDVRDVEIPEYEFTDESADNDSEDADFDVDEEQED